MVFSTIIFLLRFLPITLALYYLAPPKLKNTVLFLCSLCLLYTSVVKKADAAIDANAADKDATVLAAVSAIDKARAKGVIKKKMCIRDSFKTLQVVLEAGKLANYDEVVHTGLYSSLRVVGRSVLTPQAKQPFELNADSVEILGDCPADEYPLQKKKMSMEYLPAGRP